MRWLLLWLEIIGESWLGLLGADSLGISSDFTRPLPAAISPRLLIGLRKTGYLDLSTGPGDSFRDISGYFRIRFWCRFCGTSAGHLCGTRFRANLKPQSRSFFLRDGTVTFSKNIIESCWTSIVIISQNRFFRKTPILALRDISRNCRVFVPKFVPQMSRSGILSRSKKTETINPYFFDGKSMYIIISWRRKKRMF